MIEPDPNTDFENDFVSEHQSTEIPPRPAEKRLTEVILTIPAKRITLVSTGRSQAAKAIVDARANCEVTSWYIDNYQASLAQSDLGDTPESDRVQIVCSADWPANKGPIQSDVCNPDATEKANCDLAAIVCSSKGESELTRDMMQTAFANLPIGGCLAVSTDNTKDKWLNNQIREYAKSVKTRVFSDAIVYYIIKQKPLKKIREFGFQLAFRDQGNLIQLYTRPGVFAHRQFDNGARQILDTIEIEANSRIIDIGCGSGPMALALAKIQPGAQVLGIDSNARAIDCVKRGALLNEIENIVTEVNHDGSIKEPGTYDLAIANPPYYANFRIAEHFFQTAIRALRPGGRLMLVSKHPKWYQENITRWLEDCEVFPSRRYHLATGLKPVES